jgi:hypothetical protein
MQPHYDLRLLFIACDFDVKFIWQCAGNPEMSDAAGALGAYEINSLPGGQIDSPRGALGRVVGGKLNEGEDWIGRQGDLLILNGQDTSFTD